MKKFVNHVDHAVYLSSWEKLDENIAQLEALTGASLERCERPEMGAIICVDWTAGLEVVAPMPDMENPNQDMYDRLESHGEGLLAVVYAVEDLEAHKAKLEAQGMWVGDLMETQPDEPWYDRIVLRERFGPPVMGSWMVFSQIDYRDDLIKFVSV